MRRRASRKMSTARKLRIAASDVVSMFPTLVWKLQLEASLRDRLAAAILPAVAGMRRELPPLERGQGWQSSPNLHELEPLREFVSVVDDAGRLVLNFLRSGCDEIRVTGCWANVLTPGAAHRAHSHPNNYLSGVYYLSTRPGADTIAFHDPRRQTYVMRAPVTELTAQNTDQVVVEVSDGTLLVFPSWLEHSVDANRSEAERISLSFNLMFADFAGKLSSPLW